ncbi:MAG: hypothetical protein S4CHLAM6_06310 [Chlamydiae bacterium]|nr:hypothetical protein [Chlamydiota bacterium]
MALSHKFFNAPRIALYIALTFAFSSFAYAQVDSFQTSPNRAIEEVSLDEAPDMAPAAAIFDDEPIKELSYWKEFFRMMFILGIILGVVLVLAWFLRGFLNKRVKQVNQNNIIKVIERRNLSQKSMLYLVEVNKKQFLIGDSAAGGVEYLKECTPEHPTVSEANTEDFENKVSKASFMEILQKKLTQKNSNLFKQKK